MRRWIQVGLLSLVGRRTWEESGPARETPLAVDPIGAGIRRAGRGVVSLQTALLDAGAKSVIGSQGEVEDGPNRRLFEHFYAKLWGRGLGKAEALWQAKMALKAEGHPERSWAGRVLLGDPD